jgi:hypothetical protein
LMSEGEDLTNRFLKAEHISFIHRVIFDHLDTRLPWYLAIEINRPSLAMSKHF